MPSTDHPSPRLTIAFMLALLGLLAACAPGTPVPATDSRSAPTLAAPGWIESAGPITSENVAQVAYLGRLDAPDAMSTSFAHTLSPDSTRLVVVNNEELLGFDLLTGALVFRTGRGDTISAFYSPDKTEIYAAGSAGIARIYDAETGGMKTTFPLVTSGAFSGVVAYEAFNGWLAAGERSGAVVIWDMTGRALLGRAEAMASGAGQVLGLAFSDDGQQLAAAGTDVSVRLWQADAASGWGSPVQAAALVLTEGQPGALAFSPQGDQIAIGTDRDTRLWPFVSGADARRLDSGAGAAAVTFAPVGNRLVTASTRGLTVWDTENVRSIGQLPNTSGITSSAAFSPDGALLVTSVLNLLPDVAPEGTSANPNRVSLWNVADAGAAGIGEALLPVDTAIARVDWTEDGRLLLLFSANGPIYLWGIGSTTAG